MPQLTPDNPEEIDISRSNSKRVLELENPAAEPVAHECKKQRVDKEDPPGAPSHTKKGQNEGAPNENGKKVDPTELASAFALASLANLSPGGESRDVKQKETKDQKEDGVRNAASWDETRSPKADQHPLSPEQRSSESSVGLQETPKALTMEDRNSSEGSRRVTFHPNTKEHSSPSSFRARSAASRRLAVPPHRAAAPHPGNANGMIVSPRPHRYFGAGMPPYMRTPPHVPSYPTMGHMHHGPSPPLPPRHPGYHHLPGAFHHPSPMSPHHHPHNPSPPGAGWYGAPRMGYPPRHLMQPPLMHPSADHHHPQQQQQQQQGPQGGQSRTNQWICDFCNIASFETYEAACIHEESCKLRVLSMSSSQESPSLTMSRSRSMEDDGSMADVYNAMPPVDVKSQEWHTGKTRLATEESDREVLSELNCYIRKYCVEAFSATADDVASHAKTGHISLNQVGVRCCFCARDCNAGKAEGEDGNKKDAPKAKPAATSFPNSIMGLFDAVKRWQRLHLEHCDKVPEDVHGHLSTLANNNFWHPATRQYWADSARALGLVDTNEGIRFGKDPSTVHKEVERIPRVPSGEEIQDHPHYSPMMQHPAHAMRHLHNVIRAAASLEGMAAPSSPRAPAPQFADPAIQQQHVSSLGGYIVYPEDMEMIPPYVYFLMRQVEPCLFTEADRFVARSKGPVGYPGFQCRHCNGHAGLGKYFPVSSKSLSTNSTSQNIHAHLLKCRKCPDVTKDRLVQLKIEKSRAPRLEPGWRKVFFDKVWTRLHDPTAATAPAAAATPEESAGSIAAAVPEERKEAV
jgi:hypothetical protein